MMALPKKLLYPVGLLVTGSLAAYFIAISEPEVVPEPYEPIAPTVRVLPAKLSDEYLNISSQGTVQPEAKASSSPRFLEGSPGSHLLWSMAGLLRVRTFCCALRMPTTSRSLSAAKPVCNVRT